MRPTVFPGSRTTRVPESPNHAGTLENRLEEDKLDSD